MPVRTRGLGLLNRADFAAPFAPRQDTTTNSGGAEPTTTPPPDPDPEPSNPVVTPPPDDSHTSSGTSTTSTDTGHSSSTVPNGNGNNNSNNNGNGNGNGNTNTNTNTHTQPRPPVVTPSTSIEHSTEADGDIVTITHIMSVTAEQTPTISSPPPKETDEGGGMSTATVTGIAVAGGIAAVAVIAFIVWKWMAGRKRLNEFDADEIKWPELKEENHALPARPTGRHGAGLDGEDDTSTLAGSAYGSTAGKSGLYGSNHIHNDSASHLLPAGATGYPPAHYPQYTDNPAAAYQDPYAAGPGAAAMMAGRQSPGPAMAYGARAASPGPGGAYGGGGYDGGRAPPGPVMAYGGRAASPGPGAAYGGRAASPGPGAAYGGRAASPGPGAAYGGRAASPGPGPAYGGYDAGRRSPGPHQAYGGV